MRTTFHLFSFLFIPLALLVAWSSLDQQQQSQKTISFGEANSRVSILPLSA